jgi:antitoxin component of MazEF toxin-antitoxin module
MPSKIERKIIQAGSSKVAALPPDWLKMFNLDIGSDLDMIYNSVIIIKPRGFHIDPELMRREIDLIVKLEEAA